ncbi:MAG: heparinase II/III-family protein [Lachnospiraceae bacterium]|nr:heparinase II/III-family protein [Lachnospiraceae bacterium]
MVRRNLAKRIWENSDRGSLAIRSCPFPAIEDRDFWDKVPKEVKDAILQGGEDALHKSIEPILLSDYREFSVNGNRSRFERKYFDRRKRLSALVLAECVSGDVGFLTEAIDSLYSILEETTWCLPAHNSYIRDTTPLPVPDPLRPVIDLFSAETAALVSMTGLLLGERLNEVSPFIKPYIWESIEKRILKPYLNEHFWWMGDGKEPLLNWTPWITQNVLLAVFSCPQDRFSYDEQTAVIEQAVKSVDYFLDDYGDDGCCNEGAQYYGHAGLCLMGCIELLNLITCGCFEGLYREPLIRNIASYILHMYAGNGYYINYADCSPFPGKRSARDFLFAKRTENKAYEAFAAEDYRSLSPKERLAPEDYNLFYRLLLLENDAAMKECDPVPGDLRPEQENTMKPDPLAERADVYFESTGLMIARSKSFVLAAKAGCNADSHNHNDVGSVTVYKNGKPLLIDIGVETYTAKTFSPRRYEIWTMQSAYHNTVNFTEPEGGMILQKDGEEYRAVNTEPLFTEEEPSLSFEMAGAYGDGRIMSCYRKVALNRKEGSEEIKISDRFQTKDGVKAVLTFMTYERPEMTELCSGKGREHSVMINIGESGKLCADNIKEVKIETCPITDERLKTAWKHDCYRVLLYAEGDRTETVLS